MEVQNKVKIGIITDTASDLASEMYQNLNIEQIPFFVEINGKSYQSGKDITVDELFAISKKEKKIPRTSQITPALFMSYFKEYLEKYQEIIYISLGSGFSGTFNNAYLAASEIGLDKVHVIDSQNLSSGEGLLVLKACKLRDLGKSADEIISEVQRCVPLVRTSFSVETLEYLHLGGRCSGASKLFGTLLKIKPIIKVVDGKMMVAKKPIGSYKKALDIMLESFVADLDNIDLDNVLVTHCKADSDAVYLIEELKKYVPENCIHETYAESIVSTHCGPRTIGILYILK